MVRDSEPLYLLKSPLIYVLAQVAISPVLSMARFVPDIQERLRRSGYVRFFPQESQQLVLGLELNVQKSIRWIFSNKENTEAIVLSPNFVVLETTRYDRFETFIASLQVALATIGEIVEPTLAERLGLRYVNRIGLEPGESFGKYLQPGLLGLPAEQLKAENLSAAYQITGETPAGQFVVQLTQNNDGSPLPPDLLQSRLEFSHAPSQSKFFALLDIDNFILKQFDFAPDRLIEYMGELHRFTDRAFRVCTTPEAMQAWQAHPVSPNP